jgi:hypothetical protein
MLLDPVVPDPNPMKILDEALGPTVDGVPMITLLDEFVWFEPALYPIYTELDTLDIPEAAL